MYQINFDSPVHVHFIGIGGISMSGLAEVLLQEGFTISGSDSQRSELTRHLEEGSNCLLRTDCRQYQTRHRCGRLHCCHPSG